MAPWAPLVPQEQPEPQVLMAQWAQQAPQAQPALTAP